MNSDQPLRIQSSRRTLPPSRLTTLGAAVWILGVAQFLVVNIVAQAAWTTPYSIATFNISDLGNVHCRTWDVSRPRYVCSPLHDLMNTSFAALGVALIVGVALTSRFWGPGFVSWTGRVIVFTVGGAWILVGLTPADVDENLHVLGALIIMGIGNIGLAVIGLAPRANPVGRLRVVTLAVAVTAVVATWLFFSQTDPGIGLGGAERVAAFGLLVWIVVAGVTMLASRRTDTGVRNMGG